MKTNDPSLCFSPTSTPKQTEARPVSGPRLTSRLRSRRATFAAPLVGLILLLATLVTGTAPASAAAGFNHPTMFCSYSKVTFDPAIWDYPDYLATTDAYWRAYLMVWDGSRFVYAGQYREGRVRAGSNSMPASFDVSTNYSYQVIVRRWNWHNGSGWVRMYTGEGTVAGEIWSGYFTGRDWCTAGV